MELGRYLNKVDWSILDLHDTCEGKNKVFTDVISTGLKSLNLLMPEKMIKFHHNDPPWITEDFKCMVKNGNKLSQLAIIQPLNSIVIK
jgi:hypothetical protein